MLAHTQVALTDSAHLQPASDKAALLSVEWISGASVRLSPNDLSRIIAHPHTRAAAYVVALIQALLVTWGRAQDEPVVVATYVFCAGFFGIALAARALQLAVGFAHSMGWQRLVASPVQGTCLALVTLTTALFGSWLTQSQLSTDQLVLLVIASFLFAEAAMAVFAILWIPTLLAPTCPDTGATVPANSNPSAAPQTPNALTHPATVVIGDTLFDCRELQMMSAENSYIAVATRSQHRLIRARLSDAAQQIPARFGILAHRSCWVARATIRRVERLENRQLLIITQSGTCIPVARARRQAVQDWLSGVGITVSGAA